ncbi:tetratricopeptide repeat protein [Aliiglaciecola sp. CAU 1673]|uniref:tetratricopeptide repeat protein n=1 Tax=Aliiglaciecola sp. CAU 1673 TaxID=3032595 RepID=UPI0023DBD6C4|nr:tetratricopeptide repeat protein [Aliiglaciecola sp. CAU 1673]MDF2177264.1 tetratricopeptide repeat protein [Aliiglaciecola sp. CAU 1673]
MSRNTMVKIGYVLLIGLVGLLSTAQALPTQEGWQAAYQAFTREKLNVEPRRAKVAYHDLIDELKHQIADCHTCAEPWLLLGMIYREQAQLNSGLSSLKKAKAAQLAMLRAVRLDENVQQGFGLVQLGLLYLDTPGWPLSFGDKDKALMLLQQAREHFPQSMAANFALGRYYFEQRDFDKSLTYLETAINMADADNSDPLLVLDLQQARDMLRKITR